MSDFEASSALAIQVNLADDVMWTIEETDAAISQHRAALCRLGDLKKEAVSTKGLNCHRSDYSFPLPNTNMNLHMFCLAKALLCRYLRTGKISDLEDTLIQSNAASEEHSDNIEHYLGSQAIKGFSLRLRYEFTGTASDLDGSVAALRQALSKAPSHNIIYLYLEAQLGCSLIGRFDVRGHLHDLDEAFRLVEHAHTATNDNHPYRDFCLFSLAKAYNCRYMARGNLPDAHKAVELHSTSMALRPIGYRDRHLSLCCLFCATFFLNERCVRSEYLVKMVSYATEALKICPTCGPFYVTALWVRSIAALKTFDEEAKVDELNDAINYMRQAIAVCPSTHSVSRARLLIDLSSILSRRIDRYAKIEDVSELVQLGRDSLRLLNRGNTSQHLATFNLAASLVERYQLLGNDNDLHEIITICQGILSTARHTPRIHNSVIAVRVKALLERHMATGDDTDITKALKFAKLLPIYSSTNHGEYDSYHIVAAAIAHKFHYLSFKNVSSLDTAIRILSARVDHRDVMKPSDILLYTDGFYELINVLRLRYVERHDPEDLVKAMFYQEQTMKHIHSSNLFYSRILCATAHLYLLPGTTHSNISTAMDILDDVVKASHAHPRTYLADFLDSLDALDVAIERTETFEIAHALSTRLLKIYEYTASMLPQIVYLGLNNNSRLQVLRKADSLGTRISLQSVLCGRLEHAVELLEQTHGLFWLQHLRLRTPLDMLPADDWNDLKNTSLQIEAIQRSIDLSGKSSGDGKAFSEDQVAEKYALSRKYDQLVDNVRSRPGWARFMMNREYEELSQVASRGPVVILLYNSSGLACGLLVQGPGICPERVSLPDVSYVSLLRLIRVLGSTNRSNARAMSVVRAMKVSKSENNRSGQVLSELWASIMRPVIMALELQTASGRERPRLWVCPTGLFSRLPVHAAGCMTGEHERVSDYCVVSYTPTVGALLRARADAARQLNRAQVKLLVASASKPTNMSPLYHAHQEIAAIQLIVPPSAFLQIDEHIPISVCARSVDVLAHIERAAVLHLACHGIHDVNDTLRSGFVMEDEVLTLSQIVPMSLPNAFLAFLSACESARSDEKQPNQAVGLAAAMLFAGFKSVIGTMWTMHDVDRPRVAAKVYEEMFKSSSDLLDPDDVPYALDDAVQEMRREGLHMTRWVTYAHLGV